jgi:hypothetical protein
MACLGEMNETPKHPKRAIVALLVWRIETWDPWRLGGSRFLLGQGELAAGSRQPLAGSHWPRKYLTAKAPRSPRGNAFRRHAIETGRATGRRWGNQEGGRPGYRSLRVRGQGRGQGASPEIGNYWIIRPPGAGGTCQVSGFQRAVLPAGPSLCRNAFGRA